MSFVPTTILTPFLAFLSCLFAPTSPFASPLRREKQSAVAAAAAGAASTPSPTRLPTPFPRRFPVRKYFDSFREFHGKIDFVVCTSREAIKIENAEKMWERRRKRR